MIINFLWKEQQKQPEYFRMWHYSQAESYACPRENTVQLLLSISSPLETPAECNIWIHRDSLTYSGKASDDLDSKRVRQTSRLTQLIYTKEEFNKW